MCGGGFDESDGQHFFLFIENFGDSFGKWRSVYMIYFLTYLGIRMDRSVHHNITTVALISINLNQFW